MRQARLAAMWALCAIRGWHRATSGCVSLSILHCAARAWVNSCTNTRWTISRTQPATHLLSEVRDACSEGLEFAQHRGFTVQRHLSVSRLYLAEFNPAPFAGIIEAAEATGICFFTLADVEMTLENQRKLYELHRACAADNPAYEGWDFPDLPTFCHTTFDSPRYLPGAHLIAADGEHWIGLASLDHYAEQRAMHNGFTGVLRTYRGRHLALALKLLSISVAQSYNVDYLYTNDDSTNAPMLAINRRLG